MVTHFIRCNLPELRLTKSYQNHAKLLGKLSMFWLPVIDTVSFEGAILVLAEIEALPSAQRPCYVTARGLYNGAFVRVGDGDQHLTPYEIDRLRENSGQPAKSRPATMRMSVVLPPPLRIVCRLSSRNRHPHYPGSPVNLCA